MLTHILHDSPALCAFLDQLHLELSKPQHQYILNLADALLACEDTKTLAALQRQFITAPDVSNMADFLRISPWYAEMVRTTLRANQVAWALALAEMYVQGVSTRKVKAVTEKLCGVALSSTQVSHAATLLDTDLEKWRNRPLGEYLYLFLDAYYEQVREDGQVRHLAVFPKDIATM